MELIKDLINNRKELEKASKVILNEQFPAVIMQELPTKMGDLVRLILPCEFGNLTMTHALVDLGASINLIPFSFFQET